MRSLFAAAVLAAASSAASLDLTAVKQAEDPASCAGCLEMTAVEQAEVPASSASSAASLDWTAVEQAQVAASSAQFTENFDVTAVELAEDPVSCAGCLEMTAVEQAEVSDSSAGSSDEIADALADVVAAYTDVAAAITDVAEAINDFAAVIASGNSTSVPPTDSEVSIVDVIEIGVTDDVLATLTLEAEIAKKQAEAANNALLEAQKADAAATEAYIIAKDGIKAAEKQIANAQNNLDRAYQAYANADDAYYRNPSDKNASMLAEAGDDLTYAVMELDEATVSREDAQMQFDEAKKACDVAYEQLLSAEDAALKASANAAEAQIILNSAQQQAIYGYGDDGAAVVGSDWVALAGEPTTSAASGQGSNALTISAFGLTFGALASALYVLGKRKKVKSNDLNEPLLRELKEDKA